MRIILLLIKIPTKISLGITKCVKNTSVIILHAGICTNVRVKGVMLFKHAYSQ